ncbi:putative collagen-binding domain-containing protein [Aquimarina agarivorans]|uniref:putative collagen-binding domain-containing protein n=1 Tax=Aquimarina agarivorans TaxID=980584 RepID=UPI0002D4376C|nr:putative collagen-binding domain-containing protein [Aquimarina agarivorans]
MDEIGLWHTGALPDSLDPTHNPLRQHVLWGSLLSGAAGVEWYFGAKHPHNDLSSEDWRQRNQLWELNKIAKDFFNEHLPFWQMQPKHELLSIKNGYCFQLPNEIYAIYLPKLNKDITINLKAAKNKFKVFWYDPLVGGKLKIGSVPIITGSNHRNLGFPTTDNTLNLNKDWVVLLKKL